MQAKDDEKTNRFFSCLQTLKKSSQRTVKPCIRTVLLKGPHSFGRLLCLWSWCGVVFVCMATVLYGGDGVRRYDGGPTGVLYVAQRGLRWFLLTSCLLEQGS